MQMSQQRFGRKRRPANRNVDVPRWRGSQGTYARTLVPTINIPNICSFNMVRQSVIAAVEMFAFQKQGDRSAQKTILNPRDCSHVEGVAHTVLQC